jgi:hypothetical protein
MKSPYFLHVLVGGPHGINNEFGYLLQNFTTKARLRLGRSQDPNNFGTTLSILGLLFGPKLLINIRTLTSG